jgi:transposase-like protein
LISISEIGFGGQFPAFVIGDAAMEIFNQIPLKEKQPIGRKPKWTQEFMQMVGRKVVEGEMTLREAGKTFGMSHGTVSVCVKRFKKNEWKPEKLVQTDKVRVQRLENQTRELKHEIAELYLENVMLKKALLFSRQIKKENSSVITSETLDQFQRDAK